jgi:hypothetical protein
MAIVIQPYTPHCVPAVAAFNRRLLDGGVARAFQFPETNVPAWLPQRPGRRIYQEFYVAAEDSVVRGAYILKFQDFSIAGRIEPIAYYHLPISEGIVDRSYSSVGVQMLRSALKAHPRLFCLGMGGFDRPLPQMLKALGWQLWAVPFYFRVAHPARFLREIAPLRQTAARRAAAAVAAATGLGWLGITALNRVRTGPVDRSVQAEIVDDFGAWANDVWDRSGGDYSMIAVRDRETLNILYPRDKPFVRVCVRRAGAIVGWAVALDTRMTANQYFGNLRVGSIVDCCAAAADTDAVVQAATAILEARGVDLVVSNQSHLAWTGAFERRGFLHGPSNFIFAASKALAERLAPLEERRMLVHMTRGDGDGPINL